MTNQKGPVDVALDSVGQLHAIQISDDALSHRVWNGTAWRLFDDLTANYPRISVRGEPQNISVVIDANQRLLALIANREFRDTLPQTVFNAYVSWRILTLPSSESLSLPAPVPESSPTPIEQPLDTSGELVESTDDSAETPGVPMDEQGQRDGLFSQFTSITNTDNVVIRLAVSLVPVAVFLVVILAVGLWIVRRIR